MASVHIKPSDPLIQTLEVNAGITVNTLIIHLQELIIRDPVMAECTVVHTEFGLLMPSKRVGINIEKGKVFIG